ncbi:short-chain dehydrogenase/reductase SDR [Kribbella flavida DSM 17836]|uniref:Short-chain dehydrogenase/reductase SDR n=1 Tax=Kribbella flavida (strain DSM 17836 / JCM 10339 / NBRC 14399) TaxID=479435 RepID=D2PPE0_KRIFD|nr:SDR family oxidoreductase [Kribbella flavida]ADB30902.1 short-chain dehydrogenase/reductase SDR [Kribbella flavida DSM 17836]
MSKTWFITGTSSGFGRLMTEKLLARGDTVVATVRRTGALDDLQAQYADRLDVVELDVTDSAAVRRVVDAAFTAHERIDVVVSNAGYGLFGAAEELTDEQIRQQIDTNLIGSMQLIRAALPHLRTQGGGRIVQVSSEGGQYAYPGFSAYHATKWGIEGFVEAVAQEVAGFGIEFTLAEPGPAQTEFGPGLTTGSPLEVYEPTPAGQVRRAMSDGSFELSGDPVKFVQAMIDTADQQPAPRRLTLGSSAYQNVRSALQSRLDELDRQKDLAYATDLDA